MRKYNRVALALNDELNDVLTELSGLTGAPKTTIITELLLDNIGSFHQVVSAIKEAKAGQIEQSIKTTAKFITEATLNINQASFDLGELKGRHGIK